MGRPARKYSQARRVLELYQRLLRPGGQVSPRDDCGEFGCDKRTLQRDMALLGEVLGDQLTHREEHGHGWVYRLTAPHIGGKVEASQVLAIITGAKATRLLSGRRFNNEVRPVLEQLLHAVDHGTRTRLRRFEQLVHVTRAGDKPYSTQERAQEHLGVLAECLMRSLPVEVSYLSHRRASEGKTPLPLVAWPLSMVLHRGGAYFVVEVPEGQVPTGKCLLLALDRITDARPHAGGQVFDYPRDFDVEAFFAEAFGVNTAGDLCDIVVRVSAELSPYELERVWHASQRREHQPDGSVHLHLRVRANQEVLDWVAAMGHHAEVLEPPELRAAMVTRLRATLDLYGG